MGVKVEVKMIKEVQWTYVENGQYICLQCFFETLLHLDKANKLALYSTSAMLLQNVLPTFTPYFDESPLDFLNLL